MITITQTCDGCGATREIASVSHDSNAGWRAVSGLKHLCADCINKALETNAQA